MRRFATLWRLGSLFVAASRTHADGTGLPATLQALAASARPRAPGARSADATRALSPHPLSDVVALAARALQRHPALAERAVRVAFAELGALCAPYPPAAVRAALAAALPTERAQRIEAVSARPLEDDVAEQTHAACVDGTPVCLILLRVDVRARLFDDLDLARRAARFAAYRSRRARTLDLQHGIARVRHAIHGMLDLRQRAADQSFLRHVLRDDRRVVVPEVLWDYCGEAVLTTRAIRCVPLTDGVALREAGLDPAALIAVLIECFFEISVGSGMAHAGLDAAGARVSIEDGTFGRWVLEASTPMVFLATHERGFLATAAEALLRGDHRAATRAHITHLASAAAHPAREMRVESTYRRAAQRFGTVEGRRGTGLADLLDALGQGALAHAGGDVALGTASHAAALSRSAAAIEALAHRVAPDLDIWVLARDVMARVVADQFGARGVVAHLVREMARWPHTLPGVPRLLSQRLDAATRGRGPGRSDAFSASGVSASADDGPDRVPARHPE